MKISPSKLIISSILFVLVTLFAWYFNLGEKDFIDIIGYADEYVTDSQEEGKLFTVIDVVDGDTIKVDYFGQTESVRLIGIDTPEKSNYGLPEECYAREATEYAESILINRQVYLVRDYTQEDRDVYDRLLRYLILADQTNFNQLAIENGYAFEYTYDKPYVYQLEFQLAEEKARNYQLGLWNVATCNGQKKAL